MGKNKNDCWIEIHQVCGDCGRRIKEVIPITNEDSKDKEELKHILRFVRMYYPKYNMACKQCSNKR